MVCGAGIEVAKRGRNKKKQKWKKNQEEIEMEVLINWAQFLRRTQFLRCIK